LVADVSKPEDIERLVEEAKQRYGTVHVLVNNAGGPATGDILSLKDEDWQKGHDLTLMSMVRLTRAVLPMMIQQRWGRIITITSDCRKAADQRIASFICDSPRNSWAHQSACEPVR